MKSLGLAVLIGAFVLPVWAARPWTVPALREWSDANGSYTLSADGRIVLEASSGDALAATAAVFAEDLATLAGVAVPVVKGGSPLAGDIFLTLGETDSDIGDEGYVLTIATYTRVSARTDTGVFHGTRTVLQLLRQYSALPAGTARDWPDYPERGLMLVVQRRDYSLEFLQRHIKELAWLKLDCLHLHLSDNAGFAIESTSHPELNSLRHYTKAEMADLIELASRYHVMILPEIDVPSHSQAILWSHPELALSPYKTGRLDISNPGTLSLVTDLLNEYLDFFPAPYWHTGADEYLFWDEYVYYPQLWTYARQIYGPTANAQDLYIAFVNQVDSIVKAHGKQLRAWNDVYGVQGITQSQNPDIILEMWWPYITPEAALAKGNRIVNTDSYKLYYILGAGANNDIDPVNLYENWAPYRQWTARLDARGLPVFEDLPASTPGILGAKIEAWGDPPDETAEQLEAGLAPNLRALAQNTWGSEKLVPTFNTFTRVMDAVGHAPGWAPDFALLVPPAPTPADPGHIAQVPLRLLSIDGFSQPVTFACTPVSANTTCSVGASATPAPFLSAPEITVSVGGGGRAYRERNLTVQVIGTSGTLQHTVYVGVNLRIPWERVPPGPRSYFPSQNSPSGLAPALCSRGSVRNSRLVNGAFLSRGQRERCGGNFARESN